MVSESRVGQTQFFSKNRLWTEISAFDIFQVLASPLLRFEAVAKGCHQALPKDQLIRTPELRPIRHNGNHDGEPQRGSHNGEATTGKVRNSRFMLGKWKRTIFILKMSK